MGTRILALGKRLAFLSLVLVVPGGLAAWVAWHLLTARDDKETDR